MSSAIEAVMLGAGNRGTFAYGAWALMHPGVIRFTAVVEPHEERRQRFAAEHRIPPERQLRSWEELAGRGRLAQALFNCTPDALHLPSTLPALALGYDVMLEKPIAATPEESQQLVLEAERRGALLVVAHVLRYTAFFAEVHRIIASGELGEVMSFEHRENVSYWHMAHSFVRGHSRREDVSPMLLAKCCHDLDLLTWNLGRVARVASFGRLLHFRPERAPAGAPARCTDGCSAEAACPYSAPRLYLGEQTSWPVNAIAEDLSLAGRRRALETGPWGRCVYRCDNSVVDQQTVSLELESGASGVLVMQGHSHDEARTMRYDGTLATLRGRFQKLGGNQIEVHRHLDGSVRCLQPDAGSDDHGGGDDGLMRAFAERVRHRDGAGLTGGRESLESHLLAAAAERARRERRVVELDELRPGAEGA